MANESTSHGEHTTHNNIDDKWSTNFDERPHHVPSWRIEWSLTLHAIIDK